MEIQRYCGPSRFTPNFLKKFLSPDVLNTSCLRHDINYGKKQTFKSAFEVNIAFYEQMNYHIGLMSYKWYKYCWYKFVSIAYFILVTLFIPVYWIFYWVWLKKDDWYNKKKLEALISQFNKKNGN